MWTASSTALVFPVDTSFHQKARRPGGLPRHKAIKYAKMQVLRGFVRGVQFDDEPRAARARLLRCRQPNAANVAIGRDFKFD